MIAMSSIAYVASLALVAVVGLGVGLAARRPAKENRSMYAVYFGSWSFIRDAAQTADGFTLYCYDRAGNARMTLMDLPPSDLLALVDAAEGRVVDAVPDLVEAATVALQFIQAHAPRMAGITIAEVLLRDALAKAEGRAPA